MSWPKNKEKYRRRRDIEKKVDKSNFYSRPDVCELDAYLDPATSSVFQNKGGISPTIQGIMRVQASSKELFELTGGKMFMKSFPEAVGKTRRGHPDPSLLMEVYILRYLSYFSAYKISPCIQQYYMDFVCKPSAKGIASKVQNEYGRMRPNFIDEVEFAPDKADIRYVMTELIQGKELRESLGSLSDDDLKKILFQIFYTTNEMHNAGVRHNDLHDKNVLLVSIPPTDLHFITKEGVVVLEKCKWLAKIIDYDRASFFEKREWVLDSQRVAQANGLCQMIGSCAVGPNPKRDQVILLSFLIDTVRRIAKNSPFLERFVAKVSSDPKEMLIKMVSKYKSGWPGHLCLNPGFIEGLPPGNFQNQGRCDNWVPNDSLFMPFNRMVKDNIFEVKVLQLKDYSSLPPATTWISLEVDEAVSDMMVGIRRTIREARPVGEPPKSVLEESKRQLAPAAPVEPRKPAPLPAPVKKSPTVKVVPRIVPRQPKLINASKPMAVRPRRPPVFGGGALFKSPPKAASPKAPVFGGGAVFETPRRAATPKKSPPKAADDDLMSWRYTTPPAAGYVDDDPMDWE